MSSAKSLLLARLTERGYRVVHDADAYIVADGTRIEPVELSQTQLVFALPAGCREITLRSNVFVPAQTMAESVDNRELGVCIRRLQINGLDVELESCASGWREVEWVDGRFARRWTTGATPLPAGAESVIVDLAGVGYYWRGPRECAPALSHQAMSVG